MKKILEKISFFSEAKRLGIPFWQHPQFLFLVFGILISFAAIFAFWIPQKYLLSPEDSALLSFSVTGILFFFAFLITKSLEKLLKFNQLKNEILNILAHNLSSPVVSLKWLLESLEKKGGKLDSDDFEMFKRGVKNLEEAIDKVILVTGLEKMTIGKRKENFSISKVTEELVSDLKKEIEEKKLKLKIEKWGDDEIFENKKLISWLIKNLLRNAISYSLPENRIFIKTFDKKNRVFFKIEDEGVGIRPEERKGLFQKFFRGESSLKYQIKGMGLGLYASKLIIERAKGKIGYLPKEKGSIFWFSLPKRQ